MWASSDSCNNATGWADAADPGHAPSPTEAPRPALKPLAYVREQSALRRPDCIVKLRSTVVFDAQHGGFTAGSSPVSWGSID